MIDFASCLATELKPPVSAVPGMTAPNERRLLQWYAERAFSGAGALVDIGSWLGSATVSLAAGLAARRAPEGAPSKAIHAFDSFVWRDWMEPHAPRPGRYREGDSFLGEFRETVAPWRETIRVHAGDLNAARWSDEPIELIFVDAMKTWSLARSIALGFFPSLIARKSFIVHQDIKHHYAPWIHLLMYRLRDHCPPAYDLPESSSIVFSVERVLDARTCEWACDFPSYSLAEIDDAFRYTMSLCGSKGRREIAAARAMLFVHLAKDELRRARAVHGPGGHGLRAVERYVKG